MKVIANDMKVIANDMKGYAMSKNSTALVSLLLLLLVPFQATAETPISGFFELKFGSYKPDVDSPFQAPGPYERVFGTDSNFFIEGEYDHQLWRGVGSLAVGLHVGFTKADGNGRNSDGTTSTESTSLKIIPVRLSAIYRFDWLAVEYEIPLVPFIKAGLDYAIWWSLQGNGDLSEAPDNAKGKGYGGTFGYHFSFGMQFLLDWLTPGMARAFDLNSGVNNSYLFVEYLLSNIDDFGSDSSISLGDNVLLIGISFEF